MKHTDHECKINGLHVVEITIKNRADIGPTMEAGYALMELGEKRAELQAKSTSDKWSVETLRCLSELLKSMERDLLPRHFKIPAGLENENEKRTESGGLEEVDQV